MPIEELNFKPQFFDTVIMMENNFGLFGSYGKALRKLHEITSKEASIIAETRRKIS